MATTAAIQAVQEAYIAYYGRPADPAGLTYWADRVDSEGGIDSLIGQFGSSSEATARFGSLSLSDAVDAIYQQVFNRVPDVAGKAFYLDKVLRGEFSLVTLAQNIWDGATGSDASITANKLTAGQAFTDALAADDALNALYSGDDAAQNARNWLSNVDDTEASVTEAADAQAATIASLQEAPSNPGSTFSLTTATSDLVTGTSRDDTITAAINTLHSGDTISDGYSDDNDVLSVSHTGTAGVGVTPKVTNIETINLDSAYLTTGIDLTNVLGTTTLNANSSLLNGTVTVSGANTLAVAEITAGDNLSALNITSAASGTRDTVSVSLGEGVSGTITGGAGVDAYSVSLGSGSNVVLTTLSTSTDSVTLSNDGTTSFAMRGTGNVAKVTINASGDLTVNAGGDLASGLIVNSGDSDTVTINFSGASLNLNGLTVSASGGTTVLDVGNFTANATVNLGAAIVDEVQLNHSGVGSVGTAGYIYVNQNTQLVIGDELRTATTVGVGTGSAAIADGEGTLLLGLAANQSGAQSNIVIGSSVGTLLLSAEDAARTMSGQLTLNVETDFVSFVGSNALTLKNVASTNTSLIMNGANLGASLTMTMAQTAAVTAISGTSYDDSITLSNMSATIVYTGDGDDTVTVGGKSGRTVYLQDGDDTFVAGTGTDTIYGGDGADTFRINLSIATDDTIADFVVGTDVLQLHGAGDYINVTTQSGASGVYAFAAGMAGGSATLTGVTATDFSGSIQVGYGLNAPVEHMNGEATGIVASGSFVDYVRTSATADSSFTLGAGADYIELVLAGASAAATTTTASGGASTTITDFVVGEDVIVLTGSGNNTINVHDMSGDISSGVYSFGSSAGLTLMIGGVTGATTDIASSVRFGFSGSAADAFHQQASVSITLGDLNDYVVIGESNIMTMTGTLTIKDGGGVDFITAHSAVEVRYDLTGISLDLVTGIAAGATKIANALSGSTYVFADGESGTAAAKIEYVGTGTQAVGEAAEDQVATFLNAALGGTTGETYLAVINDLSGNAAYTYLVSEGGDGVITADELSLITVFNLVDDTSGSSTFTKADLS